MMTHKALVRKMLKQPAVKAEYDAQAEEFALLDELLKARRQAGLTQAEVAARMGTKTPAVARLEGGGGSRRHSPSVATLRKYAQAVGCRLEIRLRPRVEGKSKEGIGRVFFCLRPGRRIMMLHAFVKKSARTPAKELKVARNRLKEVQANDDT